MGEQFPWKRYEASLAKAWCTDDTGMASRRNLEPRETSRTHKKIEDCYIYINERVLA